MSHRHKWKALPAKADAFLDSGIDVVCSDKDCNFLMSADEQERRLNNAEEMSAKFREYQIMDEDGHNVMPDSIQWRKWADRLVGKP